jgi:hypothetical protein
LGLVASEDGAGAAGTEVTERESAPSKQRLTANSIEEESIIGPFMAVSEVANAWPETRKVFERYGIPWRDSPVPSWEPIVQAAAVRGYGPTAQQRLVNELNAATGLTEQQGVERRAYKLT